MDLMGMEESDELLREGWQALDSAEWELARSCFERALEEAATAEALDGLSQAVHFEGEYGLAIELKERAFAQYRDGGNPASAADVARWLAFLHGTFHGNFAVASGWMALRSAGPSNPTRYRGAHRRRHPEWAARR